MKILTALSGIFLALGGAFCYMYQSYAFAELAFVMGVVMLISGVLCIIAYLVSSKEYRLPDTLLVESIVAILFGFAVLNNQVGETMVSIFFGAWLTLAGASRLSQSVAISRVNPKDWARVLPLAALCTLLGTAMMMPTIVSTINSLILVGAAFILNGLSQIIYAMYMYTQRSHERELEAIARAEAKKQAAQEKNAQEQKLRTMDEAEREALLEKERELKHEAKERAKEEKRLAREMRKEEKRDLEKTLELTQEEVTDIIKLTEKYYDDEPEEPEVEEQNLYPVFRRPTDIPSLRAAETDEEIPDIIEDIKLAAINLEELEERTPEVNFEPVVLPEVELVSEEQEPVDRKKIMKEINKAIKKDEVATYTPISLEELVAEPMKKRTSEESDKERFTNTFIFNWDELPLKDNN